MVYSPIMRHPYEPKYLGTPHRAPIETVDLIPWRGHAITVTLECAELTSLCPVTGQPDFGTLVIRYRPDRHLIESKSLKLYLMRFRNEGIFSEMLVDDVAGDLYRQVQPHWISVRGLFRSRGGIALEVEAHLPSDTPLPGNAAS